ncbi:unnamed protein product [Aphanomyces euteiches]|uniref:N-acetyltransferase domain-containing protein n=1 Tax=Aphanomyces euteiches TaxID=100861 RepID=A0A6G0WEL3_9STRA|nr:hypothetical protein Ae201684_015768 [Aphanomyces euteiches]KAH9099273.1 hypothetical protein Ae201684P_018290 [Aphanomyces euteiches]KAH9138424.1 hypothetical protein AeRB84_017262 [Aphanomyces euteiches]
MLPNIHRISRILLRVWFSTSSHPVFRVATRADVDAIADLTNTTFQNAKLMKGARTSSSQVARLVDNLDGAVIVAETNNQIIGCIYVEKPDKLYSLTVNEEWQNQDIGSHLVRTAAVYAKHTLGMTKFQGPVPTSRPDLFEFYARLGSVRTGIVMDHPEGGGLKVEIVMKEL